MHYTALHNYSVAAGRPPVPAQKAPAMAAFTAIAASSGELMVPENAGVVIQAKSGINAIRVSGTATTTAGFTGPGTTANQIQFYSNDTIVGAFDSLGLYTKGLTISSSDLYPFSLVRTGVNNSVSWGTTIQFKINAPNSNTYAQIMGGIVGGTAENTRGWISLDTNNNGSFKGTPSEALIYGDWTSGVTVNPMLRANNNIETPLINVFGAQTGGGIFFTGDTPAAHWQIAITGGYNLGFLRNQNSAGVGSGWIPRFTVMSDGGLSCAGAVSATAFNNSSDVRLKKSITPLASALSSIMNINPVNFLYNYQSDDSKLNTGFIAQDLKKVIDNVVDVMDKSDENLYLGVNMPGLVPYIVKAMQEQQAEITELKLQNADFKTQLDVLKAIVDKLIA